MSKTTTKPAASAPAAAAAAAPAARPAAPEPDEHHGKGGSYVIENGVRRLVERTQSPDEAAAAAQPKE